MTSELAVGRGGVVFGDMGRGVAGVTSGDGRRGRSLGRASGVAAVIAATAALALASGADAQTWNSNGGDNNWGTGGNWVGGVPPLNDGTASVTFGTGIRLFPNVEINRSVRSVTFNTASTHSITATGASTLTVAGTAPVTNSIAVTAGGTGVFTVPVIVANSSTFSVTSGGLHLRGGLTMPPGGTLTLAPAAGTTIASSGLLDMTISVLSLASPGTVNFTGVTGNVFNPGSTRVQVSNGQFVGWSSTGGASGSVLPNLTVSGTGVVRTNVSRLNSSALVQDAGVLDLLGTASTLVPLRLRGGVVSGVAGSSTTFTAGIVVESTAVTPIITAPFNVPSPSALDLNGNAGRNYDAVLNGAYVGTLLNVSANGNAWLLVGSDYFTSSLTTLALSNSDGSTSSRAYFATSPFGFSGNYGVIQLRNGVDLRNATVSALTPRTLFADVSVLGTSTNTYELVSVNIRSLTVPAGNTVDLSESSSTGTVVLSGRLNQIINSGTNNCDYNNISVTPSGTFTMQNAFVDLAGTLSNFGTTTFGGLTNSSMIFRGPGTIQNRGLLAFDEGFLSLRSTSLALLPGSSVTFPASATAYVELQTGARIDNQISLTLPSSVTLGNSDGSGTLTNSGSLSILDASVTVGQLVNSGTMSVNSSAILGAQRLTNAASGTLTINQMRAATSMALFNFGSLQLPATGSLSAFGPGAPSVINSGILNMDGGVISNFFVQTDAGGLLVGHGTITSTVTGSYIVGNSGTVRVEGGLLSVGIPFNNFGLLRVESSGVLGGTGTLSNQSRIQGDGTIGMPVINGNAGILQPTGTLGLGLPLTTVSGSRTQLGLSSTLFLSQGYTSNAHNGIISLSGGTLDTNNRPLTNSSTGNISGWGNLSASQIRNSGAITFAGGSSLIDAPLVNDAGRTVRVQSGTVIFTSAVTNNGTISVVSGDAVFTGGFSGGAPTSGGSPTSVSLVNAIIGTGTTTLSPGAYLEADGLTQSALQFLGTPAAPATLRLPSREPTGDLGALGRTATASLSMVNSVSATSVTGTLIDLTTNDLLVRSTPDSHSGDLARLRSLARQFVISGGATGLGTSSSFPFAAVAVFANTTAAPGTSATLGAAFYDQFYPSSVGGVALTNTDILVRYTYLGDTDLDGTLTGSDLVNVIEGFSSGTLTGWSYGDFDYDGDTDTADLQTFMSAYAARASLPALGAPPTPAAMPSGGGGAVPEPAAVAPLGVLALAALTRRRRQ